MIVPYRKWPAAADTFHDMLLRAKKLKAEEACDIGMVDELVDDQSQLIPAAISMVKARAGKIKPITNEAVTISSVLSDVKEAFTGQVLSWQVLEILAQAISKAAASSSFTDALQLGYEAFGDSACTDAAKESITAFLERRKLDFRKTG